MFWDVAVVLKPTQEAPAASAPGSSSLPGTLAKSELLDTHGNMACPGEVNSLIRNLIVEVSQSLFRGCWSGLLGLSNRALKGLKGRGMLKDAYAFIIGNGLFCTQFQDTTPGKHR